MEERKKERRLTEERRKERRLTEENEISIDIVSEEEDSFKETISYNNSQDISVSGAKIQGNILLPVNTILKIDITLKNLQQKITSIGKVKWNKVLLEDTYFEAGIEFIDKPDEAIQNLYDRERTLNEEWAKAKEITKYEIPQGEDYFIPEDEWSKAQEINKKEKVSTATSAATTTAKPIKSTIKMVEGDMKACRYCAGVIKSDALKCEHCGRTQPEETVRKVFL